MKKFIFTLVMASIMTISAFSVSATPLNEVESKHSITVDGKIFIETTKPTPYGDPAADPIARADNPLRSRAVVVTASDVKLYEYLSTHGNYEYIADGYVTAATDHYARAEIWVNGVRDTEGFEFWGVGRVQSWTQTGYRYGTARIFYGD